MQTVAVDFDGVIHTYDEGWQDGSIYGKLVPGAHGALLTLMQRYAVFVHTTRDPSAVATWIEFKTMGSSGKIRCTTDQDCPFSPPFWNVQGMLLVTNRKLAAIAYIDDRGIRFTSWKQTMHELELITDGFGHSA